MIVCKASVIEVNRDFDAGQLRLLIGISEVSDSHAVITSFKVWKTTVIVSSGFAIVELDRLAERLNRLVKLAQVPEVNSLVVTDFVCSGLWSWIIFGLIDLQGKFEVFGSVLADPELHIRQTSIEVVMAIGFFFQSHLEVL